MRLKWGKDAGSLKVSISDHVVERLVKGSASVALCLGVGPELSTVVELMEPLLSFLT